jgi:NADPH:quinone reductase-like Zn-dependent oxidoreductase
MIVAKHNHADLERLAQLLVDGELTPIIDTTYPLQERDAPRRRRNARGKLVIT